MASSHCWRGSLAIYVRSYRESQPFDLVHDDAFSRPDTAEGATGSTSPSGPPRLMDSMFAYATVTGSLDAALGLPTPRAGVMFICLGTFPTRADLSQSG
jgi:hypothetical protein